MGKHVDSSAETQVRLMNHLSKKKKQKKKTTTLGTNYARTLRQVLYILNTN